MSCRSCASGGCGTGEAPKGCGNKGHCASGGCTQLDVFDWLAGMERPFEQNSTQFVEVRFKNTRKEFYKYTSQLNLKSGDIVVTEAAFGFDIGVVSLAGELVRMQMNRKGVKADSKEILEVLRIANQQEIDVWQAAQKQEKQTMLEARKMSAALNLDMKIGDVEYQGDGSKAIFYYIAEDRVDFRELIKKLASSFKVRVEMKQIGARQEAGRIGGIGSCGRELCCSTWLTDFRSVSTSAARYQQLSINPLKLAGQCGKLKCCLNYELDSYLDALKDFPRDDVKLETKRGRSFHQKSDIFKGLMWYSYADDPGTLIPLSIDDVKKIIALNQKGKIPEDLKEFAVSNPVAVETLEFEGAEVEDSLTRFDNTNTPNKSKKKNKSRFKKRKPQNKNNN